MKIPAPLLRWLVARADALMASRSPDFIIGTHAAPYLLRWWAIRRNRLANVYLHKFYRSDDDRALHDHPWFNVSIVLSGLYTEHTIRAGGIHHRVLRSAGDIVLRSPWAAHRVELTNGSCRTLFLTGPRIREWGFHCPDEGWIHWRRFTDPADYGQAGAGCDAGKGPRL